MRPTCSSQRPSSGARDCRSIVMSVTIACRSQSVLAKTLWLRQAMVTLMRIERQSLAPDGGRWLEQVGRILATLGFALIEPDRRRGDEVSHVVVALRAPPTLQHFAPEMIDYWITEGARSA